MRAMPLLCILACILPWRAHSGGPGDAPASLPSGNPAFLLKPSEAAQLGFSTVQKNTSIKPTPWEAEKFGLSMKWRMTVKSRFPSPLGKTWFYRFVLEEEAFPDSAAARFRLDSLHTKPPKLKPEDRKSFPLRRAFAIGNRVVLVRSDVSAYMDKLEQLTAGLKEISYATDPAARTRLLDSLGRVLKTGE